DSEMPTIEAVAHFRRAIVEMKSGKKQWDPLYDEYSRHLQRKIELKNSAASSVSVSKLVKVGPFLVSEQSREFQTLVTESIPQKQRAALLKSAQGDLLLFEDPENHRVVLYHVRDVYLPVQYKKVAR